MENDKPDTESLLCMKCGGLLHFMPGATEKLRIMLYCPLHVGHIPVIEGSKVVIMNMDALFEMMRERGAGRCAACAWYADR